MGARWLAPVAGMIRLLGAERNVAAATERSPPMKKEGDAAPSPSQGILITTVVVLQEDAEVTRETAMLCSICDLL
jgi:hypothetical protein